MPARCVVPDNSVKIPSGKRNHNKSLSQLLSPLSSEPNRLNWLKLTEEPLFPDNNREVQRMASPASKATGMLHLSQSLLKDQWPKTRQSSSGLCTHSG
jgi:hypothetical protein